MTVQEGWKLLLLTSPYYLLYKSIRDEISPDEYTGADLGHPGGNSTFDHAVKNHEVRYDGPASLGDLASYFKTGNDARQYLHRLLRHPEDDELYGRSCLPSLFDKYPFDAPGVSSLVSEVFDLIEQRGHESAGVLLHEYAKGFLFPMEQNEVDSKAMEKLKAQLSSKWTTDRDIGVLLLLIIAALCIGD